MLAVEEIGVLPEIRLSPANAIGGEELSGLFFTTQIEYSADKIGQLSQVNIEEKIGLSAVLCGKVHRVTV